ncbi:MAG TPA: hypothetical protein VH301_00155, partial [Usitatibacter sp.]|nr:hypothetical protein [Usitatibacter sp.]
MKRTHGPAAAAVISFAWIFASTPAQAQVESVVVKKDYAYVQSGPTAVSLSTASNNYGFSADVNGTNIAGIAAPVVTGPINASALGSIHNNGKLVYSAGDRGWRWGTPNANDFGTSSLASLDSFFGSGTYTITVQGIPVSVVLSGDAYPNAPVLIMNGGSWSNGKYVIDASQALTVTTNAYTGYGTHKDDLICAGIVGPGYPLPFSDVAPFGCAWLGVFPHQFHSTTPSPNFVTFTMPPYSLAGGNEYTVVGIFEAVVDENPAAGLPGSRNVAGYEVNTTLTLSVTGAASPPANGVQVSGSFSGTEGGNGSTQASFACTGTPNCVGTITVNTRDGGCSNSFSWSTGVAFTGLDVTHAHSFAGAITVDSHENDSLLGNGSCSYSLQSQPQSLAYDGTWDGNQGTLVVHGHSGDMHGTFKSSLTATPVFPMTVTGSVTPTTANIAAQVQFRPQDVGTTGKVFVFALAPASKVKSAILKSQPQSLEARFLPEDDPIPCVLAQLSASGQLTGVTASSMQAYVSGVLGSQGQSVNVLNNVPTPSVAGATFFVGYGPDASAMINGGVNLPAVTVPGDLTCAPQPPQTGWWWNPAEPGRGFSIEAKGNNLFFAAFHYDPSGRATWNVSPGPTSLGGSLF